MSRKNVELALAMGKRMAERRKDLGWTQESVAEAAGMTHQQYNKVENGRSCVGSATLKSICDALKISADYLLYGCKNTDTYPELIELMQQLSEEKQKAALMMVRFVADYENK